MQLRLISPTNGKELRLNVDSILEAELVIKENAHPNDKCYLYIKSSMREVIRPKRYSFKAIDLSKQVKAGNGRTLSGAEVKKQNGL